MIDLKHMQETAGALGKALADRQGGAMATRKISQKQPKPTPCFRCNGTGAIKGTFWCWRCGGTGTIKRW